MPSATQIPAQILVLAAAVPHLAATACLEVPAWSADPEEADTSRDAGEAPTDAVANADIPRGEGDARPDTGGQATDARGDEPEDAGGDFDANDLRDARPDAAAVLDAAATEDTDSATDTADAANATDAADLTDTADIAPVESEPLPPGIYSAPVIPALIVPVPGGPEGTWTFRCEGSEDVATILAVWNLDDPERLRWSYRNGRGRVLADGIIQPWQTKPRVCPPGSDCSADPTFGQGWATADEYHQFPGWIATVLRREDDRAFLNVEMLRYAGGARSVAQRVDRPWEWYTREDPPAPLDLEYPFGVAPCEIADQPG